MVNQPLLQQSKILELNLKRVADRFYKNGDLRWLFSQAHYLITFQIVRAIEKNPGVFRSPDALMSLNLEFGTAFVKAAENISVSAP